MTKFVLLRAAALVLGVCCLIAGAMGARHDLETAGWPTAPAKIIIAQRTGSGGKASGEVVAAFSDGQAVYHCGTMVTGEHDITRMLTQFHPGQAVQIHHSPADPGRCVLKAGLTTGNIAFLVGGLIAVVLALWAHTAMRRGRP